MSTNTYNPLKDQELEQQISTVNDSDVVSGWFFRKFINDYKEYDKQQKEVIRQLQKELSKLRTQFNKSKELPFGADEKDKTIIEQRKHIAQLTRKLANQKEELKRLRK